jgi:hypothetical protein
LDEACNIAEGATLSTNPMLNYYVLCSMLTQSNQRFRFSGPVHVLHQKTKKKEISVDGTTIKYQYSILHNALHTPRQINGLDFIIPPFLSRARPARKRAMAARSAQ